MPVQHTYRPQHLALAIALAFGCTEFAMAQQNEPAPPSPVETTEELLAQLDNFISATETKPHSIKKVADWNILQLDERDDLVRVLSRGSFTRLLDGGEGVNVLQLDNARGGTLGETRNFMGLDIKQGEWTLTGSEESAAFSKGALVRPKATLINNARIGGRAVTQGNLINNGTILGEAEVDESGTFSGNGYVGALNVRGKLAVNRLHGAPIVTGDMKLSNTSVLAYEVNTDGRGETIKVGGTASLGGATLKIIAAPGDYPQSSQYTLIEANKIEGRFGNVENDLAFMTPALQYEEQSVGLTYTRNEVPVESVATSENGRAFARSIEEPTAQNIATAAITALLGANVDTAAIAIDQLAGDSNANLAKATLSSDAPVSASLLSAMRQLDSAKGYGGVAGRNSAPRLASDNEDHSRVWIQALGHGGKLDRADASALQFSTEGLLLGADWDLDEQWRLGVMGGKSQTRLDGSLLDGDLDSWHLGAYALRQSGPASLRLGMTHSNHDGNTKRRVAFNGFSDRPKGRYDATTQQAFAEAGYNLGRDVYTIEPFASLGYQRYQRDSYTEKGGAASLQVQGQTQDNINTTVGLRLAKLTRLDNGMQLTPRFSAGWKHTYGEVDSQTQQKLVAGGSRYTAEGAPLDRDTLMIDAGLDLALSARHTLGLGINGEVGTDSRSHGVTGQWRIAF